MTDNGAAALGAALHHYRGTCELWTISEAACSIDHRVVAAAILGPRGVFLPEGLGPVMVGMAEEIARLRAALPSEATLEASIDLMGQMAVGGSLGPTGRQLAKRLAERLRAALAAKETP